MKKVKNNFAEVAEVSKYKKRAVKNTPKKANHKHSFATCYYLCTNEYKFLSREYGFKPGKDVRYGTYCVVCGKIGVITSKIESEFDSNIPVYGVDDVFRQKYIDINQKLDVDKDELLRAKEGSDYG